MSPAVHTSVSIAAYLALFASVGLLFLFVNLLIGKFLRPSNPHPEKREIYECGEPTIGSSFVQFDLRFYVVALLFIVFDVEVAFFFPWATVYGKTTNLMDERAANQVVERVEGQVVLTPQAADLYRELGVRQPQAPTEPAPAFAALVTETDPLSRADSIVKISARHLTYLTLFNAGIFFFVLLVGFAYDWRRGDLSWVRAFGRRQPGEMDRPPPRTQPAEEPVLSA